MKPEESFVGQPIRSVQTMLRTIAQIDERQPNVLPDGIYGSQTARAVSAFQRNHGLPVTGAVDQRTHEHLVRHYQTAETETKPAQPVQITLNPGQVIRRGEENPNLYLIQAMLYLLSLSHESIPEPVISGILDEETFRTIQALQLLSGLPASGELDKTTWKHLALQYARAADQMLNSESR